MRDKSIVCPLHLSEFGCRTCFDRSLTNDGAHSDGSPYRGSRPGRTLVGKSVAS